MKRKNRLTQKMAILLLASVSLFVMAGKLQAQEGQKTKKLINVFVTDALIVRGYGSVRVAVYVIDDSSKSNYGSESHEQRELRHNQHLGSLRVPFFQQNHLFLGEGFL